MTPLDYLVATYFFTGAVLLIGIGVLIGWTMKILPWDKQAHE